MIGPFINEYRFLSNFDSSWIDYKNHSYSTVEHAFQASKAISESDREWVASAASPGSAKRRGSPRGENGRVITLRSDWNEIRVNVMLELVRIKFAILDLRAKLLATGEEELVEVNWWHDTWGVENGIGENHLGKILMQVRWEINNETTI
jgi:ribA/ribD-fused uncharacterized protein